MGCRKAVDEDGVARVIAGPTRLQPGKIDGSAEAPGVRHTPYTPSLKARHKAAGRPARQKTDRWHTTVM
jgi:hypothetical protein